MDIGACPDIANAIEQPDYDLSWSEGENSTRFVFIHRKCRNFGSSETGQDRRKLSGTGQHSTTAGIRDSGPSFSRACIEGGLCDLCKVRRGLGH